MTIEELKKVLETYPDDQFVHIRIWFTPALKEIHPYHKDIVVDKVQQGVDGALLITGSIPKTSR